jgi:hypothetical protein
MKKIIIGLILLLCTGTANAGTLVWADLSDQKMGRGEALSQIKAMNDSGYSGYTDWRIPTKEELKSVPGNSPSIVVWGLNNCLTGAKCLEGVGIKKAEFNFRKTSSTNHFLIPVRSD